MSDTPAAEPVERRTTAPPNYNIAVGCFAERERAEAFGRLISNYVSLFGEHFDLANLDGVTIAGDYNQALAALDRGFETITPLSASTEFAQGVAMSPLVVRHGKIKTHIVLNGEIIVPIESDANPDFDRAVQILAHECAHVEITSKFDACFPGTLLQPQVGDFRDELRWPIIMSCWDEYAASFLAAPFGRDLTEDLETTFLHTLDRVDAVALTAMWSYRVHGDHGRIAGEIFAIYGALLRYASYQVGNLASSNRTMMDLARTKSVLQGHWFEPHCSELEAALNELRASYGSWGSKEPFERLGDVAEQLVAERGLTLTSLDDGTVYVDVPFNSLV